MHPLKRAIQTEIMNPLAQKLLSGDVQDGSSLDVDYKDGAFVFSLGEALKK